MLGSANSKKPKVVLLTSMIPPYRIPLFVELAEKFQFTLIVDCMSNRGRQWKVDSKELGFDFEIMNGKAFSFKRKRADVGYAEQRPFHLSYRCFGLLRKKNPDLVVSCEFGLKTIWSILYCKLYGKKLLLWSEGTMHTEGKTTLMRRIVRPFLVKLADGFWTNGPESRELLVHYGARDQVIQEGITGVDTEWWKDEGKRLRKQRDQIRDELGLEKLVFVFNGSISPRKGIRELMKAFEQWKRKEKCSLILLGSGELEEEVDAWLEGQEMIHVVRPGFIDPKEIPRYLIAANWAILPTLDDNWPLATLEVLVAGVPQLFSVYNGATSDLCIDGITGYSCDPLDTDNFVESLIQASKNLHSVVPNEQIEYFSDFYSPKKQAERANKSVVLALS